MLTLFVDLCQTVAMVPIENSGPTARRVVLSSKIFGSEAAGMGREGLSKTLRILILASASSLEMLEYWE